MPNLTDNQGVRDGVFVISSTEPLPPPAPNSLTPYYSGMMAWYNPEKEELKWWNGSAWLPAGLTTVLPEELKLASLVVTKRLSVGDDEEGVTAEIKTEGGVLVFKNGVLVKYG